MKTLLDLLKEEHEAEKLELLEALSAALPFVEDYTDYRICSSAGGPAAIRNLLQKHNWQERRVQLGLAR